MRFIPDDPTAVLDPAGLDSSVGRALESERTVDRLADPTPRLEFGHGRHEIGLLADHDPTIALGGDVDIDHILGVGAAGEPETLSRPIVTISTDSTWRTCSPERSTTAAGFSGMR